MAENPSRSKFLWYDDKIVHNHHVHVGVVVAAEDGLLAPVLRFANELTFPQIGRQKDLLESSKQKSDSAEMEVKYIHHI